MNAKMIEAYIDDVGYKVTPELLQRVTELLQQQLTRSLVTRAYNETHRAGNSQAKLPPKS
jgi:hypothetical protein